MANPRIPSNVLRSEVGKRPTIKLHNKAGNSLTDEEMRKVATKHRKKGR